MRTSSYRIQAGERIEIAASGNYVRVRKSAVELIIENGEKNEIVEVSEGDDFEFSPFKNLYITNAGATTETIKLTISSGKKAGSAKVGGSVAIVGAVELGANSLAALERVDLNAVTSDLLRFETYGASYKSTTALAANTADTIFTAAANVNGAIIHSAQFADFNAGTATNGGGGFLAKATAPATVLEGDSILGVDTFAVYSAAVTMGLGSLKNPVKIPAGKGLFFITGVAQSNTNSRSVLYTLL